MPANTVVCVAEQDDQFTPVRTLIKTRLDEMKIPSIAVAIAKDGKIIWEEGFGLADIEKSIKATPDTMYSLASITKPITATALMILKERGEINMDLPINDYLGDAKVTARVGDANEATVLRVANHTSGLPLHWHFFSGEGKHIPPNRDETIRRYANLVTAPGEKYQYSNLGYGILDYVIARQSGKSYSEFLKREVFAPLGMKHASVNIDKGLEKFAAARYTPEGARLPMYDFDHPGASAVYCSAHDLVRFGMFHLKDHLKDQKQVLSDDSIEQMQTPIAARGVGSSYGVGWPVGRGISGHKRVEHSGGMPGVSTELLLFPNQDIAIVVLCNTRTPVVDEITDKIVSVLLPDYQTRLDAIRARGRARDEAAAKAPFKPGPELVGEWNGSIYTYKGQIPVALTISDSGTVHIQLGNAQQTQVSNPKSSAETFTGEFQGLLGTEDTMNGTCDIELDLRVRGDTLNGSATATSQFDGANAFGLTHWIELKKTR